MDRARERKPARVHAPAQLSRLRCRTSSEPQANGLRQLLRGAIPAPLPPQLPRRVRLLDRAELEHAARGGEGVEACPELEPALELPWDPWVAGRDPQGASRLLVSSEFLQRHQTSSRPKRSRSSHASRASIGRIVSFLIRSSMRGGAPRTIAPLGP